MWKTKTLKKNSVEKARLEAKKSGLIDQLLKEFYPQIYSSTDGLNLSNRVELQLDVPEEILPKNK